MKYESIIVTTCSGGRFERTVHVVGNIRGRTNYLFECLCICLAVHVFVLVPSMAWWIATSGKLRVFNFICYGFGGFVSLSQYRMQHHAWFEKLRT
jgi:hypothetical protein